MLYPVSASYDPKMNGIILRLYNDETEKIETWVDTEFKPYFLTKMKPNIGWKSIVKKEFVTKYDALMDKDIKVWKITVDNPNAVKNSHDMQSARENHIKFFQCYIYDNDIKMGMPYLREDGNLKLQVDQDSENRIGEILGHFKGLSDEELKIFKKWANLLEYPAPDFKRASLDIEVMNEDINKIPNPEIAILPILTVCIFTNKGERIAYVLIQEGKKVENIPDNVDRVVFFTDEDKMLISIFDKMNEIPFIITFNGDDFDLKYLYYRALRLGIPELKIPIIARGKICMLKNGVHIDLYKFFQIRAMKIYAFKSKYKEASLDSIGKALINKGKLKCGEKWVAEMNYYDLIKYCMTDAEITLELTTYNDNLVMNLITMLERISRLPIENVSRKSVSSWVRSFMYYEHRQRNIIIPTPEEIKAVKGQTASVAIIKGKKYKGATVFEPVSGTHFNVLVLDFASLYPSIFKVYNIGYSTINCPHEECKSNKVGELPHWICTKNKALESLLIGSLRDLRVFWYKQKAKPEAISNKKLRQWYSVAEQSIKVILNASYGVFGSDSFVFYCPPVAEEITAIARYIISKTAEHAQEIGIDVLYGDTDSIFVKDPPKDKLEELIKWTQETFGIEFEVDKIYKYVCLSGRKKNYLGITTRGEIDVKGLTGKKSHTPPIIRSAFNDVEKILKEVETPEQLKIAKKEITELVRSIYKIFKNREWENMDDLSFNVTLSRELDDYKKTTPQHVKAARMLQKQGYDVESGTIIKYVKTNKKVAGVTVKPVELAKIYEINIAKYISFLKSTFEQILDPLNVDFDEDILGVTKLVNWMEKA